MLCFLFWTLLGIKVWGAPHETQNIITAVIQPFDHKLEQGSNGTLSIQIHIQEGYKAYIDQFKLSSPHIQFGRLNIHPQYEFHDSFSKRKRLLTMKNANISSQFTVHTLPSQRALPITLRYQVCTASFCYLPKTLQLTWNTPILKETMEKDTLWNFELSSMAWEEKISTFLAKKNWVVLFFIVFLSGILMSLSPCVLPLIPITLSVLGLSHTHTMWRKLFFSLLYSLGISTTYALLGVFAAMTGTLFGNLLSHPLFLAFFGVIFLLSSLSLTDLFPITTPGAILNRIPKIKKQNSIGAYLSGVIAGLIASPCVGPVLVGVLSFVAQTQNILLGFALLFVLAQGLSLLTITVALVGTHKFSRWSSSPKLMKTAKFLLSITFLVGSLYFFYPLMKQLYPARPPLTMTTPSPLWQPYTDTIVKKTLYEKPIVIDFYADWCAACVQMDQITFKDSKILNFKEHFLWLKVDGSKDSPFFREVSKKYQVFGLPTLIFISKNGDLQKDMTLNGFENPTQFKQRLQTLLQR